MGQGRAISDVTSQLGLLRYGKAVVTVPFSHVPGEIEQPSIRRLQFRLDPRRHFTLASSRLLATSAWEAGMRAQIAGSRRHALLVFIHGYNVSFEDALFRTAQIKYDVMPAGGAAMLFSWPSAARYTGYLHDEEAADISNDDFAAALTRAIAASGADSVYLIAHSMGNRIATAALNDLAVRAPALRGKIKEVILAAPDINAIKFRRSIAPRLIAGLSRTTLYASSRDRALIVSHFAHSYQRLGDTNGGVTVIPPIETIDASSVDDDLLGHSYFAQSGPVLHDIARLIATGDPAGRRGLSSKGDGSGRYWTFSR